MKLKFHIDFSFFEAIEGEFDEKAILIPKLNSVIGKKDLNSLGSDEKFVYLKWIFEKRLQYDVDIFLESFLVYIIC